MKEELLDLYRNNIPSFKKVVGTYPHDDLAGPFLMSPKPVYGKQLHPLLVIGQETNGWTRFVDEPEKQMNTYESFDVGKEQAGLAFWNTVRKVELALGNEPHSCAWTNISRFDFYGGRSHGRYEKTIASLDSLIREEIKIVAPKVCLFFTGPYFDNRLKKVFSDVQFEPVYGWELKQLCLLNHPNLPALSFRAYHPRFLKLKSLEKDFIGFISGISVYHT